MRLIDAGKLENIAAHEKMLVNVPQTLILPVSASSHGESVCTIYNNYCSNCGARMDEKVKEKTI